MKKLSFAAKQTIVFNSIIAASVLVKIFHPDISAQKPISRAYLDPSTGSMIISAIVGVFATIALGVKAFWYKIGSIFKPAKKNTTQKDSNQAKTGTEKEKVS